MTPPVAAAKRASRLPQGARALVTAVHGAGTTVERLAALGLVPGTSIEVVRAGPTLALAVGATRLALGPEWADAVEVLSL